MSTLNRAKQLQTRTDETLFWFELLVEAELVKMKVLDSLMKECEELLKNFFHIAGYGEA